MYKNIVKLFLSLFITKTFADKALVISDVHFTPFAECSSLPLYCGHLQALKNKPFTEWKFAGFSPNSYHEETNNYLLINSLQSLSQTLQKDNPPTIFVTGDMLAHKFEWSYKYYNPLATQREISDFESKTLSYVLWQIHNAFPKSKIYFVLGNNDTDNGDYELPSQLWLSKVASTLSNYMPHGDQSKFIQQFKHGGYYSIELNDKINIIGLNTNVFSVNALNSIDKNVAKQELEWLSEELDKLKKKRQRAIILEHIPLGIDVFNTSQSGKIYQLLDNNIQHEYMDILKKYSNQISSIYAGHLHGEYWQKIDSIPVVGTLALNLLFGNNAGVKLIDYDKNNGNIIGYTTHVLTFNNNKTKWQTLYNYPASYNTKKKLATFINDFTYDMFESNVVQYRRLYNGGAVQYAQPIINNKFWIHYYCYLNHFEVQEYTHCLDGRG